MDAYNAAILYVRSQVGYVKESLTIKGLLELKKARNKQEILEITNNDKMYVLINKKVPDDMYILKRIELLITQYYYGIAAKIELENILSEIGVEFNKKYT